MATIIFEQVHVSQSLDRDGNKLDIYRYWQNDYGSLGRFRATETIGFGENVSYQSYNFLADGKIADKLKKMKLKAGSSLYVVGELVPEFFEGTNGKLTRVVVKVLDARFTSSNQKKEKKEEKEPPKENLPKSEVKERAIPVPKQEEKKSQKEKLVDIPTPSLKQPATSFPQDEEILDLDIQNLFSESSGFMGMKNPSAE